MIETIKNVTKTVPIIIADRDSVMEEDVPSINNVRNLNSNKVVTKVYHKVYLRHKFQPIITLTYFTLTRRTKTIITKRTLNKTFITIRS